MEKEKKNNHIWLVTILVILLLIAFLGIGYAIGSTKTLESSTKIINDKKPTSKNLSITDPIVEETINSFNQIGKNPEDMYETSKKDLTKREIIATALKGLDNNQINYCKSNESELTNSLTIDDLNNSLAKAIKGEKISIQEIEKEANEKTSYTIGGYGYTFKYSNGTNEEYSVIIKDDKIYIIGPCGHEGPTETNLASQTEKVEMVGDELLIYQKVAFGKTEFTGEGIGFVTDYYTEKEYKNKIERITSATDNKNPTWTKYNSYVLKFKKSNDKYYFEKSNLLNQN